jgi:group II intron reverse transcriptase/maturase
LHAKAKEKPTFRFYSLYDKICRLDVLWSAWRRCLVNDGEPGVDGQTLAEIEEYGVLKWLTELAEELRAKTYQPAPVRRVYILKEDGKQRPLGIPTIKDRVVQTAALLVLEPIFEADLPDEQHAYREGHSAQAAVKAVHQLLINGYRNVVDADLSGYFDSIPHAELMQCIARRVSDKAVLRLVKLWLVAPVEERDARNRRHRTTRNRDEGRGTPQGAPISPLFSNLYMRRFVVGWQKLGHKQAFQAEIVNYADDFVICCRGNADEALLAMREMMTRLKLTVNEVKTHACRVPDKSFDFLGYTFGRGYAPRTGQPYIAASPAKKKVLRLCRQISEQTSARHGLMEPEELVGKLNRMLTGWANYFSLGSIHRAYRQVNHHARERVRQWLCRKHKVPGRGTARFPLQYAHDTLGLIELRRRPANPPQAKV